VAVPLDHGIESPSCIKGGDFCAMREDLFGLEGREIHKSQQSV
jgi:hypothetical protein